MRTLRRVVFWVFVAIYLAVCPLTVLYALGYLFEPGSEGGLVKTGLIYLSTAPPGASVYLGNQRYAYQTPTVLRDLLPGDYPVKLVLKGCQPWTNIVPVEAEKATVLERVLLLPPTLSPRLLLSGPFEQLIPVPGTTLALLTSGPRGADFLVYDLTEGMSWSLLPLHSPFGAAKVLSWTTAPESRQILLRLETREGQQLVWVELKPDDDRLEDLTSLFPRPPTQVAWDPLDKRWLFAMADHALHRVDREAKALYPKIAERVIGFGLFDKTLDVLRDDGGIARMTLEGRRLEALAGEPGIPRHALEVKPPVQLIALSKDAQLAWGERGELLANRFPYRLVERGVLGITPDAARERALVWQRDALGILSVVGDELALRWVFTRGSRIEQAFWVYEGSHALFLDGERVFLLEVETYGKPHLRELLQVKRRSAVAYSEAAGTLAFLDDDGALSSIEILPKREVVPLPFPERREEPARHVPQEP